MIIKVFVSVTILHKKYLGTGWVVVRGEFTKTEASRNLGAEGWVQMPSTLAVVILWIKASHFKICM